MTLLAQRRYATLANAIVSVGFTPDEIRRKADLVAISEKCPFFRVFPPKQPTHSLRSSIAMNKWVSLLRLPLDQSLNLLLSCCTLLQTHFVYGDGVICAFVERSTVA